MANIGAYCVFFIFFVFFFILPALDAFYVKLVLNEYFDFEENKIVQITVLICLNHENNNKQFDSTRARER